MSGTPRVLFWVVLVAVALESTHRARGTPLAFSFEGEIRYVDSGLGLDTSVYVGAPFTGGYSFDPTGAVNSSPNNPNVGNYFFASGRMWAHVGNYGFETLDLIMFITNDLADGDTYGPVSVTPFQAAGVQWDGMSLSLGDRTGTALSSDALPLGVPDLADFSGSGTFVLQLPGGVLGIRGRLTSLAPEPGSLALATLGVGACLLRRRRR